MTAMFMVGEKITWFSGRLWVEADESGQWLVELGQVFSSETLGPNSLFEAGEA